MDEQHSTREPAPNGPAGEAGDSRRTEAAGSGSPGGEAGLEARLAAAEALATQHYDAFLRSRAELENIRRRAQEDVTRAHKFALEAFAGELLPVMDGLEATLGAGGASLESLRNGVELTLKQLKAAFEKSNLREINPVGAKFDPNRHQAISAVESGQEANTVVTVLQKGYTLADRTIRPALVTVAKAAGS